MSEQRDMHHMDGYFGSVTSDIERLEKIKTAPKIRITITGPVGRGKTVIIDAIEKLLREQFDVKNVLVGPHIQQERNAMNLVDYRNTIREIIQENVYILDEETIVAVNLSENEPT